MTKFDCEKDIYTGYPDDPRFLSDVLDCLGVKSDVARQFITQCFWDNNTAPDGSLGEYVRQLTEIAKDYNSSLSTLPATFGAALERFDNTWQYILEAPGNQQQRSPKRAREAT